MAKKYISTLDVGLQAQDKAAHMHSFPSFSVVLCYCPLSPNLQMDSIFCLIGQMFWPTMICEEGWGKYEALLPLLWFDLTHSVFCSLILSLLHTH